MLRDILGVLWSWVTSPVFWILLAVGAVTTFLAWLA